MVGSGFFLPEPVIRLGAFGAIFGFLAVVELIHPRLERPEMLAALKARRWLTNFSLLVISSLCLRVLFPVAAVGTALWAEAQGIGLFNRIGMPAWLAGAIAIIVLDFAVWLEHLLSHKIPLLWRIHRMHHADTGFDVTTALRFHPFEIVISMVWKGAIVLALGAPAWSVLVFEVVLNGAAMFNHANIELPRRLDHFIRRLVVTPDMHRVHHSSAPGETDSNYGFSLSIWDRMFSTYTDQPRKGHDGMELGLAQFRGLAPSRLFWSLLLPFTEGGAQPRPGGQHPSWWRLSWRRVGRLTRRFAPLLVLLVLLITGLYLGWHRYLTLEYLARAQDGLKTQAWDLGVWALLAYIGVYAVAVAVAFPATWLLTLVGGFVYGFFWGGLLAVVGATLGASILFWATRSAFGDGLRRRARGFAGRVAKGFEDNAFSALLALRLMPILPFSVVNILPALLNVPFAIYVAATLLGIVPGALVYAAIGQGFETVLAEAAASGRTPQAGDLITPAISWGLFGLAALALLPSMGKLVRRKFMRRNSS